MRVFVHATPSSPGLRDRKTLRNKLSPVWKEFDMMKLKAQGFADEFISHSIREDDVNTPRKYFVAVVSIVYFR